MTNAVRQQYEDYPYPERDPEDERKRLLLGTPSHPFEIDHFLYSGARDWSQPFRAMVAGGGTGDGLMMLAQILADHNVPAEITYLDLSTASRAIAEARAKVRGLTNIRFETADLLRAPEFGEFDYIDCCGVLHHLPDPDAGFAALRAALAPTGGMGGMVYAPYGRAGVYEMQAVFAGLLGDLPPAERVAMARKVIETLPPTNALARNPFVSDHTDGGDAGLYDLLLHSQDRAYSVPELVAALQRADLGLVAFNPIGQYKAELYLQEPSLREKAQSLPLAESAAMAERLAGNLKTHVFYAAPKGSEAGRIAVPDDEAVPRYIELPGSALAKSIWDTGGIRMNVGGLKMQRALPKETAGIATAIDGKRTLGEIRTMMGWDRARFDQLFGDFLTPLDNFNILRFTGIGRERD